MTGSEQTKLGKLTSFGIQEPWQGLLLLPERWDDFKSHLEHFKKNILPGSFYCFRCRLIQTPKVIFKGKVPRLTAVVVDQHDNRGRVMAYGDTRTLEKELNTTKGWFYMYASLDRDTETGQIWINSPEIVPEQWQGQLRPRYPGKAHVISSTLVRDRILHLLPSEIKQAAHWLQEELRPFGTSAELMQLCNLPPTISFENLLLRSHTPLSLKQGIRAQESLMKLAALKLIHNANRNASQTIEIESIPMQKIWNRLSSVPFKLTKDQTLAVKNIMADLESNYPSKRLISGDVATGKTVVFALAAAAVADAGRTAAIMLPTAGLVAQVATNMKLWWPDLQIQTVTGDNLDNDITGQIIIGTTALLHRRFHNAPDLLVVDEQHKYSREQREQLMSPHTHLLEVSATPIPRTQALLRYGILNISKLSQRHNKSQITTRIWSSKNTIDLSKSLYATLNKGLQLLVVYPKRGKDPSGNLDLKDIHTAYEGWEKKFPGRVRMAHGAMTDNEKKRVLDAMASRQADILIATTVIEVGIDLPDLYHLLIINPERHGLVTLHQLRGRIARRGGKGHCDLLVTREISPKSRKRLEVFSKETDGFKLAEIDMRTRGIGDLALDGDKQSGTDESFLFGRSIDIDILDEMVEIMT